MNVMYVSVNTQFISFQICFGVLSRLCQVQVYKTFHYFLCFSGKHKTLSREKFFFELRIGDRAVAGTDTD